MSRARPEKKYKFRRMAGKWFCFVAKLEPIVEYQLECKIMENKTAEMICRVEPLNIVHISRFFVDFVPIQFVPLLSLTLSYRMEDINYTLIQLLFI